MDNTEVQLHVNLKVQKPHLKIQINLLPQLCSPDKQIPIASAQLHLSVQFLCTTQEFFMHIQKTKGGNCNINKQLSSKAKSMLWSHYQSIKVVRLIGLVGPQYTISSIDSIMCPGRLVVRLGVA
jgi:hypothetical protein